MQLMDEPLKTVVLDEDNISSAGRCDALLFVPEKGTTQAIIVVRQMMEKHPDKKKKLYLAFVDR